MGSHRYVRFCIDGDKFHSAGTFNDLYSKDIAKVKVGKGFPFIFSLFLHMSLIKR